MKRILLNLLRKSFPLRGRNKRFSNSGFSEKLKNMKEKELSELTDQELLGEAKKRKSSALVYALLIGFLIGIVFYSLVKNTWGFFTLIPLFFIYKLVSGSRDDKALEVLLKERGLK